MAPQIPLFLAELKRRKVYHVAAAYLTVGAVIVFGIPDLSSTFGLPPSTARLIIILVAIGFPIALVLAWAFEVRPEEPTASEGVPPGYSPVPRTAVHAGVSPTKIRPSIAVLPLENFSPDPEDAYFADGMQEQLVATLAKISGISVRGRTSVMRYRETPKPLPEIADELGVAFVIEGSVRITGGQVSFTAQLVDAVRDEHIWAEEYDRGYSVTDMVSIHRNIAGHVVSAVRATLTPEDETRLAAAPTTNTEAYEYYLLGHHHLRHRTDSGISKAIEHFAQAVKKDSTFAPAFASLATAYNLQGTWFHRPGNNVYPLARRHAEQALALDKDLAEAHGALALIQLRLEWNWESAEHSFCRAIELNNDLAQAHYDYGLMLGMLGRWNECLIEMRRARDLEPLEPFFRFEAAQYLTISGALEEGFREFQEAISRHPDFPWAPMHLAYSAGLQGEWKESSAHFDALFGALEALGERPHLSLEAIAGHVFSKAGDHDRARAILTRLEKRLAAGRPDDYIPADMIGILYIGLGDHDRALDWLYQAYEDREQGLLFLWWWPYNDLHSHQRFQELVRRVFPERLEA